MAYQSTRLEWLRTGAAGLLGTTWLGAQQKKLSESQPRPLKGNRLIYNYDAWGPYLRGHTTEAIHQNIDLFAGSQVTTVMLSPNFGQSLSYPTEVGEMCHSRPLDSEQRAILHKGMGDVFAKASEGVAELWQTKKVDAFGLLVERARRQKLEVFGSFRMNDLHMLQMQGGEGPYTDLFYRQHPEWRVPGSWALDYAIPEVRGYRLRQLEEFIRRYPFDGLDLDFLRGVPFFHSDLGSNSHGEKPSKATRGGPFFPRDMAEGSAPLMTDFIKDVRKMIQRVSRETGRSILLSARVPSSLSGCRRVGLDPIAWYEGQYLDFLTVGHFLHLFYDLPVDQFKRELPKLPIYGCLDYIVGGPYIDNALYPRDATAEIYRGASSSVLARGADGILLYNMYVCRGNDPDPKGKDWRHDEPVEVLREVRDLDSLEGKPKLYLVDYRFDLFDREFFDVAAQLPQDMTPDRPLSTRMYLGEKQFTNKRLTLRVVAEKLPPDVAIRIQMNGVAQSPGIPATRPHLFNEPYDQMPPDVKQCLDFSVRPKDVKFGLNEVTILASAALRITRIELAVV